MNDNVIIPNGAVVFFDSSVQVNTLTIRSSKLIAVVPDITVEAKNVVFVPTDDKMLLIKG